MFGQMVPEWVWCCAIPLWTAGVVLAAWVFSSWQARRKWREVDDQGGEDEQGR